MIVIKIILIILFIFICFNIFEYILFKRKYIPILMYHRVNDQLKPKDVRYINHKGSVLDIDSMKVKVDTFEKQMRYLKTKKYVSISMNEYDYKNNKKKVAITFDDGYVDNYFNAFPILKLYNLKATIYLTTGYINTTNVLPVDITDPDIETNQLLNWEQIKEMNLNGIYFGAHTISHRWLTDINDSDTLNKEISISKAEIEKQIDSVVSSFAYPAGMFNNDVIKQVISSGYNNAVITSCGSDISLFLKDYYRLERETISRDDSMLMFKIKLWGLHRFIRKQWWYVLFRRSVKWLKQKF